MMVNVTIAIRWAEMAVTRAESAIRFATCWACRAPSRVNGSISVVTRQFRVCAAVANDPADLANDDLCAAWGR